MAAKVAGINIYNIKKTGNIVKMLINDKFYKHICPGSDHKMWSYLKVM